MTYEKKYPLRATDFDKYLRIKPSVVLELFQDVASEHAESFGAGYKQMKEKGLMWVILKTKYQVLKNLERYSTVSVTTWPLKSNGLVFRREYQIRNQQGEVCVNGCSEWAIVNVNERKIAVVKDVYPVDQVLRVDHAIEGKIIKIPAIEKFDYENQTTFGFSAIDQNMHVNNVQYATAVMDGLNLSNLNITTFQIDYHKELLEGESLKLGYLSQKNSVTIRGEKQDGSLSFNCKIYYDVIKE